MTFEPVLLANINLPNSHTLPVYESTGGYQGVRTTLAEMEAAKPIEMLKLCNPRGRGGAPQHKPEGARGGRPDRVEFQPGAAGHQRWVVPEQFPPVAGVAFDVDGQRRALDDPARDRRHAAREGHGRQLALGDEPL